MATGTASPSLREAIDDSIGCPAAPNGEIVVCRRGERALRYRIPEALRPDGFDIDGTVESVSSERHRLTEGGASGIGSCTVRRGGHVGLPRQTVPRPRTPARRPLKPPAFPGFRRVSAVTGPIIGGITVTSLYPARGGLDCRHG